MASKHRLNVAGDVMSANEEDALVRSRFVVRYLCYVKRQGK